MTNKHPELEYYERVISNPISTKSEQLIAEEAKNIWKKIDTNYYGNSQCLSEAYGKMNGLLYALWAIEQGKKKETGGE